MRKIEYRIGNLLEHPGKYILHGCNAQGVMGSGVAKAIRDKYPQNYTTYAERHIRAPLRLGEVVVGHCNSHIVFNGITQEFYGNDGRRYVNYDAIEKVMELCSRYILTDDPNIVIKPELAMPLIGADLGGGDWKVISKIIEDCAESYTPVVYVLSEEVMISRNLSN